MYNQYLQRKLYTLGSLVLASTVMTSSLSTTSSLVVTALLFICAAVHCVQLCTLGCSSVQLCHGNVSQLGRGVYGRHAETVVSLGTVGGAGVELFLLTEHHVVVREAHVEPLVQSVLTI